jgi:hypothetical protein
MRQHGVAARYSGRLIPLVRLCPGKAAGVVYRVRAARLRGEPADGHRSGGKVMRARSCAAAVAAVLTVSTGAFTPVLASSSGPVDSCTVRSVATAKWTSNADNHAVSGTWRLHPLLTCNHGKLKMSIRAVLRHAGKPQLRSEATCTKGETKLCRRVAGPHKLRRYGASIRGTWSIYVRFTFSGADAQSIASSSKQRCRYKASSLTAICSYIDGPYHIH